MTLLMAKVIRMADIERLLGPCGFDGEAFATAHPDGIDLSAADAMDAVVALFDQGLAVEYGLAVVLDQEQRTRFILWMVEERKALLGVTTQEELAAIVYPGEAPETPNAQERKEAAASAMVDIGTAGRARDLITALRATERAHGALGGDVPTLRSQALAWFANERLDVDAGARWRE